MKKVTILVVEDMEEQSMYLCQVVEMHGGTPIPARSLVEVESYLKAGGHAPNIIVWDFNFPEGNTLEVMVRARKMFPSATFIAQSGEEENRRIQMSAGCDVEAPKLSVGIVLRDTLLNFSKHQRIAA